MILADFHVHSNFSDGRLSIPEVIDFYGGRGFGAIALTDHVCEEKGVLGKVAQYLNCTLTRRNFNAYMQQIRSEAERAWRQYRMLVIPGFEITKNSLSNSRSAHMLGLNIQEFVSADLEVREISRAIRQQGGLVIAAHPVSTRKLEAQTYYLWDRREELCDAFDAWEVASGPVLFEEVLASGLPMIATSDFHRPSQIQAWKTVLQCERSIPAILQAIREQNLSFHFYTEESLAPYSITRPRGGPFALRPTGPRTI